MNHDTYTLGIDIGGTHIDVVAVDRAGEIIASDKMLVGTELRVSVRRAIRRLVPEYLSAEACIGIHLGTTLGVNALLTLESLYRVGVLRLAANRPDLPPGSQFQIHQREEIIAGFETIEGGVHYDGRLMKACSDHDVFSALERLIVAGAESLAIVSVFSPLYQDQEQRILELIQHSQYRHLPVSLSHQVGGLGFFERENNTILNASLKHAFAEHLGDLENTIDQLGFRCGLSITQNNGTLMSIQEALSFPIKTLFSGPTNSMNGACKLVGQNEAIVVDIGGTSTDIGVVENGFPRYSSLGAEIAGIATNFMLPELKVLALGGGSMIRKTEHGYRIGPESVGARLLEETQAFHGKTLTLFDAGYVLNDSVLEGKHTVELTKAEAEAVLLCALSVIQQAINSIFVDKNTPVVYVGGGAKNIPDVLLNERGVRPKYYEVANAYGAALAELSHTVDESILLETDAEEKIRALEQEAMDAVIQKGASRETVRVIEKRLLPFYYMSQQLTRVIITAAGRLEQLCEV